MYKGLDYHIFFSTHFIPYGYISQIVKNINNCFKLVGFHFVGTGIINNTVSEVINFVSVSITCRQAYITCIKVGSI